MSLDPTYLEYPRRRKGMDHDLYAASNLFARPPIQWPGSRVAIAFLVNLEWFPITPTDNPFRAPGHMQTPYPDFRHYTARDYGNRVGIYRLLDAFSRRSIKVSVAVNAAIAQRYPSLLRDITEAGHEIIAHSLDMNGTIATGLDEDAERDWIARSRSILADALGQAPRGWQSISRSQSWNTPRLLVEAGFEYMCDWVNDELPYIFSTISGDIVSLPFNHEISDRQVIGVQQQSIDSFAVQIEDAFDWLDTEAIRFGGRMLPVTLTPYITGLPYRMDAFESLLERLSNRTGVWFASAGDIVDCWSQQQTA